MGTTFNNKSASCTFYIADVPHSIIGMDIISALRLTISCNNDPRAAAATADFELSAVSDIREETAMSIKLKDGSPSTLISPVRRLPFALEEPVEREIHKLLASDVIESISTSSFVSPIVVTTKRDNTIRLCVDYRRINSFTVPDQYPIPSVDELFSKIPGSARYFSKIDLKAAYHQVDLHPDSRDYSAFITHIGLFRYKKIPYGLANAPAAFTRIIQRALKPCDNIIVYFDDILCFGATKAEHDACLEKLRSTLQTHKLIINEAKSQYNVQSIEFLGRQLSADGIGPPSKGVQALQDCRPPTNKTELRSFLGMMGYYRNFIKDFATLANPLTSLLQENVPFQFELKEQAAFDLVKQALLKSPFLAFFDTDASVPTFLTTDASGVGLGAVLSQLHDGIEKPVYFISRKLHPNETRFSSAELETLAVVWAVERLHQYVYGRKFEIRTDHSALREVLTGGRKNSMAPARIIRWASRLLPYNFSVSYIKGRTNVVADCLSRLSGQECEDTRYYDVSIAAIQGGTSPCLTLAEISRATAEDEVLQSIISYVSTKWPQLVSENCQQYFRFRDEFSFHQGLLLRGEKIVVPSCLQQRVLSFAHEDHFGMSKSKARLRRSYWWPGMDGDVEKLIRSCFCCQQIPRDSPVQITEWSTSPWYHLSMDVAGPKRDCKGHVFYIVALIDDHSRYVCAQVVNSITSSDIIKFLSNVFTYFGFCGKITTDNGVQFNSSEFTEYLRCHGIVHIRSAVYNPQANGSIERVNKNLRKLLETLKVEGVTMATLQQKLNGYLLNYNNTTHDTTNATPSELLLKFKPRTRLDVVFPSFEVSPQLKRMQAKIQAKKQRRAQYANSRRRPVDIAPFRIGDWVQRPPGPIRRIISKCGPFTFALDDGYKVNARRLKLIKRAPQEESDYVPVRNTRSETPVRRYPVRERKAVQRYGWDV